MKKKNNFSVIVVASITLLTFVACSKPADKKSKTSVFEEAETIYAVNTMITDLGNLDAYLEFGGDVDAANCVDVLPDTNGRITRYYVNVGDYVRKEQIIADIDPSRAGMTYSISPVKAPISGTVTQLPYSIGSMAVPSMSIGKISSTNRLEIKMSVPERFVSRIAMNQRAYITFDAFPGEEFNAKVVEVSPVLDNSTRTMSVKLNLDPPNSKIKVGMYARIKLITDRKKDIITIPYSGLVTRQGEAFVFAVMNDNSVKKISVKQGLRVDDKVEILEGLEAGTEIVIKGQTLLDESSKVNVISRVDSNGVNIFSLGGNN
ncbi:MAG: efflux RND transporter periplasmic adaptor subunit [Treponema sp.]|nr:efflux RND transporter periplasmic adaptor subunit [Treponema sp.]